MTVGELKDLIRGLDDEMLVVASRYNSGYGGLFEVWAGVTHAKPRKTDGYEEDDGGDPVLSMG